MNHLCLLSVSLTYIPHSLTAEKHPTSVSTFFFAAKVAGPFVFGTKCEKVRDPHYAFSF